MWLRLMIYVVVVVVVNVVGGERRWNMRGWYDWNLWHLTEIKVRNY